jgi:CspA family cold shock protein
MALYHHSLRLDTSFWQVSCSNVLQSASGAHHLETYVATGTVKWFNPTKGYGFIQPQGGGKDVFVHISAVERAGLSTLNEGATVEYEVVANRGKASAENLKVKCFSGLTVEAPPAASVFAVPCQ